MKRNIPMPGKDRPLKRTTVAGTVMICLMLTVFAMPPGLVWGDAFTFIEQQTLAVGPLSCCDVADLNKDGHPDIVLGTISDGHSDPARCEIVWFENDGRLTPRFNKHFIAYSYPVKTVKCIDLDQDGDQDIVAAADGVSWLENKGGNPRTFTKHAVTSNTFVADGMALGDLNKDGRPDIVTVNHETSATLAWIENLGGRPPAFKTRLIPAKLCRGVRIFIADLDGDGHQDLITESLSTGDGNTPGSPNVLWYQNNGARPPVFAERTIPVTYRWGVVFGVADLNGDGKKDILSPGANRNLVWMKNNGARPPAFAEQAVGGDIGFGIPADVNNDGRLDLLGMIGLNLYWAENKGGNPLTFVKHEQVASEITPPMDFIAADLNGDRDLDVVLTGYRVDFSFIAGSLLWFENQLLPRNGVADWLHYN